MQENELDSNYGGGSVNATFRIHADVMSKLRKESELKQSSLNALVNQILRQYTEWSSFEPRVGLIPFPKQVLTDIFSSMDPDTITDLARGIGKNTAIEMSIFMNGKLNAKAFLSWLEVRLKNSGCEVVRRVEDENHIIIIKHDLGKNWSLYLETLLNSTLEDTFGKKPESFSTDALVSLKCKVD